MIVDVHNHYYPPEYIDEIRRGPSNISITDDAHGNPVLHSPGDYNVAVRGHRDLLYRVEVLDRAGVDRQVLTFTAPGTSVETPERAIELAAIVNDALARAVANHGDRFSALATLPMNAPEAAAAELERTLKLGLKGCMPYSNASGVPLADVRFTPVWEVANRHASIVYIHPTYPLGVEAMTDYMLMPLVGFLMDTTLAAAHLVYAGVPERFPRIKWVLGHLGGAIPYLAERLDRGYAAFDRCREHISRPPSTYLKQFYYDTVNFDPTCLRLAIAFAGVDHVMAGSDYPHMIGSIDKMLASIRSLGLSPADEASILGGNAQTLLGV